MGRLFSFMGMRRAKQFRPAGQPTRQEQKASADRWRGNASDRGYDHRWSKARIGHLRNSPLCLGCLALGRTVAATIVDHVDPHHGDPSKFWDTAMWQSCCDWHHNDVKQRLEAMYARGAIGLADLWLNSPTAIRIARGIACDEA